MKIDYKTQCELYRPNGGCYYTFDGSCQEEKCFTYRLLQKIQELEKENEVNNDRI